MSLSFSPRFSTSTSAFADCTARSVHTGCPDGASAECGSDMPSASPTTCDVAAVPRNWQPPSGEAHARQPRSAASWREIIPCEKRAPMVWILPASSPFSGGSVTPPGTSTLGRFFIPASAIIIAGSPLSHVAMPSTPARTGSERIRRRKMIAASLRYGRLSNMPSVPCVRPSHGSEQYAANGTTPRRFNSLAAASTSRPISQWPV